jgi:hypothetical protein
MPLLEYFRKLVNNPNNPDTRHRIPNTKIQEFQRVEISWRPFTAPVNTGDCSVSFFQEFLSGVAYTQVFVSEGESSKISGLAWWMLERAKGSSAPGAT